MAYSNFTLRTVKKIFNLQETRADFFVDLAPVPLSDWLTHSLSLGLELATASASEKARSEFIVAPVLFELRQRANKQIAIYSGERLDVDEAQGLNGECDFILTQGDVLHDLQAPIFTLVEAKKNDLGAGLGQCVAQMIGARLFNELEQTPLSCIFGAVTTGTEWQFLRLEANTIVIDKQIYAIDRVGHILAILEQSVQLAQVLPQVAEKLP